MREAGADIFTVALDAVTPAIFERTRGRAVASPHSWQHYWQAIRWAAEIFGPEKFGVHLICGLGETEQELLQVAQRVRELGGHNHLFAFFPEQGSLMEDWAPVARAQWRRVQLACYLIDHGGGGLQEMRFDAAGRVLDYGLEPAALVALVASGKPFRTSGCPGNSDQTVSACNRPYGDCRPTDILSFPFAPESKDLDIIRRQLAGEDVSTFEPDLD
jgi:biotin synthase